MVMDADQDSGQRKMGPKIPKVWRKLVEKDKRVSGGGIWRGEATWTI